MLSRTTWKMMQLKKSAADTTRSETRLRTRGLPRAFAVNNQPLGFAMSTLDTFWRHGYRDNDEFCDRGK